MDLEGKENWNAAVRRVIEQHSSDSHAFSGKVEDDLFYAPKRKGAGYWVIRDHEEAAEDIRSRGVEEHVKVTGNDAIGYESAIWGIHAGEWD